MRPSQGFAAMFRSLLATSPLGLLMLFTLAVTCAVGASMVWPVVRAWSTETPQITFKPLDEKDYKVRFDNAKSMLSSAVTRVDNRSPFYPKVIAPPPRNEPPKPVQYYGPPIIAIMSDNGWFSDGRRLKVGGPAEDGLELLSVSPPWGAKVRYQGVEWEIKLFDRPSEILNRDPMQKDTIFPRASTPAPASSPARTPSESVASNTDKPKSESPAAENPAPAPAPAAAPAAPEPHPATSPANGPSQAEPAPQPEPVKPAAEPTTSIV